MTPLNEAVTEFLSQKTIAVAGVSRNKDEAANFIYRKLKETGHDVFAVNPKADRIEGDACYSDLKSIPQKIDGVVVVTSPEVTEDIARQCVELQIPRVWMHKSIGNSVSESAVRFCRENGIRVIDGGCPMMFCEPVDFPHKCLRVVMKLAGRVPARV